MTTTLGSAATMTSDNQSVNQNTSATDGAVDNPLANFDTSEADAILSGADTASPAETILSTEGDQTTPAEQQQAPQLTPEQVEQLRQQLALQQQQPQETTTETGITYPEEFVAANAKFKEATGVEFGKAVDDYMKATTGLSLKDAIQQIQDFSSYAAQRQASDVVAKSESELRGEWGNNYDGYMQLAKAEFAKLPAETEQQKAFRSSLDNAQGAKLLLAQALQAQGLTATARVPVQYNPLSQQSPQQSVAVGNQPMLRMSEILKMADAQYNSPQVQQALAAGAGRGYINDVG